MKVSDVTRTELVDAIVKVLRNFLVRNNYRVEVVDRNKPDEVKIFVLGENFNYDIIDLDLWFSEINYSKASFFKMGNQYKSSFVIHFKLSDISKTIFKRLNIDKNFQLFKEIVPQLKYNNYVFSADFVCEGYFERTGVDINKLALGSLTESISVPFQSIVALWILLFTQKNDYVRLFMRDFKSGESFNSQKK